MEIYALKCNKCGTRVYLEDDEATTWAVMEVNVIHERVHAVLHFCPTCFQEFRSTTQADSKLTSGQHRMIDPDKISPDLEAAIRDDNEKTAERFKEFMATPDEAEHPDRPPRRRRVAAG